MDFLSSISNGFRNYVTFRGRASRSEYWYWFLFLVLVGIVTVILDGVMFGPETFEDSNVGPFNTITSLITFLPSIAVGVRRLHDVDRSGWWVLLSFTVIGLIPLIYWAVQRGTLGPNRFGPTPPDGKPG